MPADRFGNLGKALELTGSQFKELEENSRAVKVPPDRAAGEGAQRAERRRDRESSATASESLPITLSKSQQESLVEIGSVLDQHAAASEAIVIGVIGERDWPGVTLCYYPPAVYASEFDLSDQQITQFEALRNASLPARPARDRATAFLNNAQHAKIAAFLAKLELAQEAIEIGLIPHPAGGEALCR